MPSVARYDSAFNNH